MDLKLCGPFDYFADEVCNELHNTLFKKVCGNTPSIDGVEMVTETEKIVEIDMPGVLVEDIDVTVDSNKLFIVWSRKRRNQQEIKQKRCYSIDQTFDVDNITSKLKNGVLTINIPKAEKCKKRKLTVTSCDTE